MQERKELLCGRILSQLQKQTGGDRAFAGEGFFPDKKCCPSLCYQSLCCQSLLQQEKLHIFGDTPATGEWLRVDKGWELELEKAFFLWTKFIEE